MIIQKVSKKNLKEAVKVIKNNGVIVYPTDTAYALGGLFDSKKVMSRIMKIKGRRDDKFTLIASSRAQVEKHFKLSPKEKKLARQYWPGPLSLVVSGKYAVRVPDSKVARALARSAGCPLIATSANLTGQTTLFDDQDISRQFSKRKNGPDLLLAAGKLKHKKTSTIVKVNKEDIIILRKGAVEL